MQSCQGQKFRNESHGRTHQKVKLFKAKLVPTRFFTLRVEAYSKLSMDAFRCKDLCELLRQSNGL